MGTNNKPTASQRRHAFATYTQRRPRVASRTPRSSTLGQLLSNLILCQNHVLRWELPFALSQLTGWFPENRP